MLIASTKNDNPSRLKFLILGDSGAGKTTLARTIIEPVLLISAESGDLVLRKFDIDKIDLSLSDKGEVLPKETRIKKLEAVYAYLFKDEAKNKYKWIFIDSLTEIAQTLVEGLKANPEYASKSKAMNMWGEYNDTMIDIIKKFRDIPHYNVVFTCLASREKDENGNFVIQPDVFGKISSKLPQYFDEVFFLGVTKDGERKIQTFKSDSQICLKDRSEQLNQYEEPNLDIISNKIKGGK
jgi:adenylate kinase family enzyme